MNSNETVRKINKLSSLEPEVGIKELKNKLKSLKIKKLLSVLSVGSLRSFKYFGRLVSSLSFVYVGSL